MEINEIVQCMAKAGLVELSSAQATPLTGGVSSDIFRVHDDAGHQWAVKQALAQLRVKDVWKADVCRNHFEQAYMHQVSQWLPQSIPKIVLSDAAHGFFVMEFLEAGFMTWKQQLMDGVADLQLAAKAGETLGVIHSKSWDDPAIRAAFETTPNFHKLRTSPYLLTTGSRHPHLESLFREEAFQLESHRHCLVHGDFSPKNLMVRGSSELVVLDCEVAWFGNPRFDVAFLFNHFLLKAWVHRNHPQPMLQLGLEFWKSYSKTMGPKAESLESSLPRLILMLLLARVDGKSPAEYLDDSGRESIRRFTPQHLKSPPPTLLQLTELWSHHLSQT